MISGTRTETLALSGRYASSTITWTATEPSGTSVTVEVSHDGGETWLECTSGEELPGLVAGQMMAPAILRETLSTDDPAVTPTLSSLSVEVNGETAFEDGFVRRTYVIESIKGPGSRGEVTIVAKDPLKLADNDRAKWPRPSRGELAVEIDEEDSVTEIDVATPDDTEYDLRADEDECYVRLGSEVFTYTGTTAITGGVRLTGVTRGPPSPYVTEQESHDVGAEVQRCRMVQGRPIDVFWELLTEGADVPEAYIPWAEWESEASTYLGGFTLQRLITEPEGVNDLLDEVIEQSMTWGIWWDEVAQQIKYRALRPVDVGDPVAELNDDDHLVADSVEVRDEPERLINEIRVAYAQRDPTEDDDERTNYRFGHLLFDTDSISERERGKRITKTIFARWHPGGNAGQVRRLAFRLLAANSSNLRRIEFEVDRKDDAMRTGEFADLTTQYLRDEFGAELTTRVQVLRVANEGDTVRYVAREDFFTGRYARIAPDSLSGLTYADATDEQRERYYFIAPDSGEFSNGDDGYTLL